MNKQIYYRDYIAHVYGVFYAIQYTNLLNYYKGLPFQMNPQQYDN